MKKHIITTIKILLTIGIFVFVFNKFNIDFSETFERLSFKFLIVASIIRVFIMPLIYINRWKLFLRHSGVEESFFSLLKISFISSFMGIALPSSQGADVVRMVMIEKRHRGYKGNNTASSSVIIERMLGFVLLAIIGLLCSVLAPYFPQKERVVILIAGINLALFFVIFMLTNKITYRLFEKLFSIINRLKKITTFIQKTHYSLISFPYKKIIGSSAVLIFLLQISSIIIVYLVFLSFGVQLPFIQHLSFYPIIAILSVIPVSISGLGLREGFFVFFYSLVGVSPEIAVAVSLINYFIEILLVASIGGVLYGLKSFNLIKV